MTAINTEIAKLVTAIKEDAQEAAADRRAHNVSELVTLLGRGGRAQAADLLDVHVSAIDQALRRARSVNRRGLQIDWHIGDYLYYGSFVAKPDDEEDDLIEKALAASGVNRPSPTCRHDYPAGQPLVVRPRGRRTGVNEDSHIVYDAASTQVCLSCKE